MTPQFNTEPRPLPGQVDLPHPLVRRLTANNPGPFTYHGTCTYLVGRGEIAVIDPGPNEPSHLDAILTTLAPGERISAILLTHTHPDHWPCAPQLRQKTGAPLYAFPTTPIGEAEGLKIDQPLNEGDRISGGDWSLIARHTPGHASNHMCFELPEANILFSGDHVMGWSTTVVIPEDGVMADYMASLARLNDLLPGMYLPGHGPAINQPQRYVRALIAHRRMRRAAILRALSTGSETTQDIVASLYPRLSPQLIGGARRSVLAHLIELISAGEAECQRDGVSSTSSPGLGDRFRPA